MNKIQQVIPIADTIHAAWQKVHGTKKSFFAAAVILFILQIIFYLIDLSLMQHPTTQSIVNFICSFLTFLLQFGILYMGIQRARDLPIRFNLMFHPLRGNIFLKAFLFFILQTLIILPFIIIVTTTVAYQVGLIAPEHVTQEIMRQLVLTVLKKPTVYITVIINLIIIIYLLLRLSLSMAFIVDQEVSAFKAIRLSFAATRSNVVRLFMLGVFLFILTILSIIPFGIGLIWTIPLTCITYGMVYHYLKMNTEENVQ